MNDLATAKNNAERTANRLTNCLLNVARTDRGDLWSEVYFGHGALNDKKWNRWATAFPTLAAPFAELRAEAVAARDAYKVARDAAKVAKAAKAAAKVAKVEYVAQHGARPVEAPNCNGASNYDILSGVLRDLRAEFVARYVSFAERQATGKGEPFSFAAATDAARFEFDSYVAKLALKITGKVTGLVSLVGNVWDGSTLTVTTDAGRQVWWTECRRNARYGSASKNGTYTGYYQWPTRRVV